jgi:hypothetical protein
LTAAQAITHEYSRADALSAVAAHLPVDQQAAVLTQALTAAQAITDEWRRADALSAVAARLPVDQPQLLRQALFTAQAITDERGRAHALSAVAARLPVDQQAAVLRQALFTAQAIPDEQFRADALSTVAAHLPVDQPQLLTEALHITWRTATEGAAAAALEHLATHWHSIARTLGRSERVLVSQTLRAFSRVQRFVCLEAIAALAPVIARLGGAGALQGVVEAMDDTARWWP